MRLEYHGTTRLPVDLDFLLPKMPVEYTSIELGRMPVSIGNQTAELGELFTIDASDGFSHDSVRIHVLKNR